MAIIPQVIAEDRASGAQVIDGSLKFDSTAGDHLLRTPSSVGNQRTFTFSCWCKRSLFGAHSSLFSSSGNGDFFKFSFRDDNRFEINTTDGGVDSTHLFSTAKFRDTTGWYHIVIAFDTTQATSTNRVKFYVNNTQITDFDLSTYPAQFADTSANDNVQHIIGNQVGTTRYFDGMISNVYMIDGQQLDASYFGFTDPLTNTWRPKKFNKSSINNGTTWSNDLTTANPTDGFSGSNPATKAFDGLGRNTNNDTATTVSQAIGNQIVWSPSQFPAANGPYTLEVLSTGNGTNGGWGSRSLKVNGTTVYDPSVNSIPPSGYVTVSNLTEITEVIVERTQTTGSCRLAVIKVNGVPLIDGATNDFGTNGFWLPMDGNSLIGEDKSGNGNDFTPVNFGGSNSIEKATGALPILNTVSGGNHATVGVRTDSNSSNLVLAVPLIGSAQDVHHIIKGSGSAKTFTINGNAHASSDQSNFYGGSFEFDGSGDYLQTADSSDFTVGSGDYTIEGWFYPENVSSTRRLCGQRASNASKLQFLLEISSSGVLSYYFSISDSSYEVQGDALVANRWYHIAVTRNGNVHTLYVNGHSVGTRTQSGTLDDRAQPFSIGRQGNYTSDTFDGYIQDFRIYKGVAKYTSNFIPASTNPDILPDTPSGVAYSSELTKITDGAVAFDGSGDFLALNDSSDFSFDGDFTVEAFVYQTVQADHKNIFSTENFDFKIRGNGKVRIYTASSGTDTTQTVPLMKWTHLALVRESGTIKVYFDGVGETVSQTIASDGSSAAEIGRRIRGSQEPFNGYISNLRVIKGTALYTSNFTPPTEPLTAVTNTKLLCCQSKTSSVAAAVTPATITANGNAAATNFNPFTDDINTIRGQETGYSTFNPLKQSPDSSLSDGNLKNTIGSTQGNQQAYTTIGMSSGKYYVEFQHLSGGYPLYGVTTEADIVGRAPGGSGSTMGYAYGYLGKKWNNGDQGVIGTQPPNGSTIGIAFDADNGEIEFFLDGVSQGGKAFTTIPTGTYFFVAGTDGSDTVYNAGQKPFKFPPPDGFQPLCLNNLPRPTKAAVRPDKHFKTMVWSGDNTTRSMTGLGFIPDLVWIKCRNLAAFHNFTDSIRGPKVIIQSNTTTGEQKPTTHNGAIDSFDPDGFTLGTGLSYGDVNQSGRDYVGWAWKGGTPENYTTPCGSVLFDGSGDYLSLPVSSDFQFGSGDFTIECWAKAYDQGTDDILGIYNTGDNRRTFALRKDQTESVQFLYSTNGSSGASASSSADVIKLGTWHHYAVVRDNLVYKIYLDGVLVATDSSSTDAIYTNNDDGLRIGSSYNTDFDGHISNVRIIKGTALYTSNFTPSSAPLTNVTNTKLLCCQSATSASAAAVAPGTFVNAGTNYSSNNQVTGSAGLVGADSIFNGHLKDAGVPTLNEGATVDLSSDNYILWTPTTGIPYNSKVEVFCYAPNGYGITTYYTFNGGTETSFVGGAANYNGNTWITVATGSGTINSIKLRLTRSPGQSRMGWYAIRVDGTILLNDQNGKSIGRYDNATPTTHNPFDMYRVDGRVYATAAEAGLTAGTKASLLTGASVNTESGFSILTWTGDGANSSLSIPHGLPSRPMMIAIKKRNEAVDDWYVAHDGISGDNYAYRMFWGPNGGALPSGSQATTNPYYLGNQSSNDTLFLNNTTTYGGGNENNIAYVAYCWSEVLGFSKFGTYIGNGAVDGPLIECGFKPAWVMVKVAGGSTGNSWTVWDNKRDPDNEMNLYLHPNEAQEDGTYSAIKMDFYSNGFKPRGDIVHQNTSGVKYIYAAFAEAPTFNLYGGQANAR